MAVVPGFTYTELREMPLTELSVVLSEVERVSEARKRAASSKGRW